MWRFVLTFSLLCCGSEAVEVTCRDENGGEVDWYILYKAPEQDDLTGLEYIYIDSGGKRTMSPGSVSPPSSYKPINHPQGVLANTLRPLFTPIRSMPPTFGFISYSDQPPGCNADEEFGHSKGVLLVDKGDSGSSGSGIWLLHSTPQFPFRRDQNHFWPKSGNRNAQTFLCVTFPYNQFKLIGTHLQYIGAFPFDHDLPDDFHQELKQAVIWDKQTPPDSFQLLTSSFATQFGSIAKNQSEEARVGDLYVSISRAVKSDVSVQTWGCQPKRAGPYCPSGKYQVLNIKTIKTDLGNWEPTRDHSKWCIAKDQNKHLICIADVNRAKTQYKRRGGALCLDNENIKSLFVQFAGGTENCPIRSIMDIITDSDTDLPPGCDTDMRSSLMG